MLLSSKVLIVKKKEGNGILSSEKNPKSCCPLGRTLWTTAWDHVNYEMCGLHGVEMGQLGFDELLFHLKGNLSMSVPQQERKQAEFFSVSHCHCAALTLCITSDRSMARGGKQPPTSVCVCVCECLFPGLSHPSLGGCDTNPYKTSIPGLKVATTDADDIQEVRDFAALAPLPPTRILPLSFSHATEDMRIPSLLSGTCIHTQQR